MAARYPADEDDADSLTSANSLRSRVRTVGIFWDMNTCGLPAEHQTAEYASLCVFNLKGAFVSSRDLRLTMFRVIVEESYPREVIEGIMSADVDKLDWFKPQNTVMQFEKAITEWLDTEGISESNVAISGFNDPSLVLVTGDVGFVRLLDRLRHRLGVETTLVHPVGDFQILRAVAKKAFLFSKFIPARKEPRLPPKPTPDQEEVKTDDDDQEDYEQEENVNGGKIKIQCYKNLNLDFTRCTGEVMEKVCKRYRGWLGRKSPRYALVHFPVADVADKAAKELHNKLRLNGVVVQVRVVGRNGPNIPRDPIRNRPSSEEKKVNVKKSNGNAGDDLEAAFQALSVGAQQVKVVPLMPNPRKQTPRTAPIEPKRLISCSKLPPGWYLQDKSGSPYALVTASFDSRGEDRIVRVPLTPPALDAVNVYFRVVQCGPILRMTHASGGGSLGEGVDVEFSSRAAAQNCLKAVPDCQLASKAPSKQHQQPQRLLDHDWKGIGIVRIVWPRRMHRNTAFLDFPNRQRAEFVAGKISSGVIEIPFRISPATVVKFSNVTIGLNPSFASQLRMDGIPTVVHEDAIRSALHAVNIGTDDMKVNFTYVGKTKGPDHRDVKAEVQNVLSQVPVQRTAIDFKPTDPNSKAMNDHGNVFIYDPVEAMMCTEYLYKNLRVRGSYVNCDFIIDLNLTRMLYEHKDFAAVITQAIKDESGDGHVSWICVKTKVPGWNALRLSSLHLGRVVRVARRLGKQFQRVECRKLAGNPALIEWLRETKAGEDTVKGMPIWFEFGIPFVPQFLESSPVWHKLQVFLETQKENIMVESGVLGKIVEKFGPRLKNSLRSDFHLAMDPANQLLTLTCPQKSPDIETARSLLAPFAKFSAAPSKVSGKYKCVLCASEADPSGKRHVTIGCSHLYCQKCFMALAYWTAMPLRCAHPACGFLLTPGDVKIASLLFSQLDPIAGKWFEEKLATTVGPSKPQSTTFFPCPTLGCTATFVYDASVGKQESRTACQGCGNEVCLRCRCFYHYAESCELYKLWLDGVNSKAVADWIKRDIGNRGLCRNCWKPIERRFSDTRGLAVPLAMYCVHCLRLLENNDVAWAAAALARLKPRTQQRR